MIRLYLASLTTEDKILYLDTDLIVIDNIDEL
jgi:lipopolysaccharide biosynthesis glycosyltransferase